MILGLLLSIALLLLLRQLPPPAAATTYDIVKYGAISDGRTDSLNAISEAWSDACNDKSSKSDPATVHVPAGTFLLSEVVFKGPCKSHVTFLIDGTLLAPSGYSSDSEYWVLFQEVNRVTIHGGPLLSSSEAHFDGSGPALWACKSHGGNCPVGRNTLGIMNSNKVSISKIRLKNSQLFNVGVYGSGGVTIRGVSVENPEQSPNTDGIHVEMSNDIIVANVIIGTGDDCISMGAGTRNIVIRNVQGGPGHGISIGSLGKNYNEEGVTNVSVSDVTLNGTTNGVRIKAFAQESQAFVSNVVFQRIQMKNVENPILIDQKYCPNNKCSQDQQESGVQISDITYRDISGTSATEVGVNLGCSRSHPCKQITLENINLQYANNEPAETVCSNADVSTTMDTVEPKITCTTS